MGTFSGPELYDLLLKLVFFIFRGPKSCQNHRQRWEFFLSSVRGGLVREDPARPKDSTPTKSNGSLEENKKRFETTVLEKNKFFDPVKCPFNVKEFLLF